MLTVHRSGYKFPPKDLVIANNAMTDTAIAPEWIDSDVCLRCRDSFTFTNRKHHCRNCGQVFDQKCSSKIMALPHFGIMQDVRVCDACHFKLTRKKEAAAKEAEDAMKKAQRRQHRQEQRHEDVDMDLLRAIELSLKENQSSSRSGYAPLNNAPKQWGISEPPIVERSSRREEDDDEDLRAAIEASLREAHAPQPSAPAEEPSTAHLYDSPAALVPSYDLVPLESDAIMTFNQTIADAEAYGLRDLRGTHELYTRANTIGPKLTRSLDDTERKEGKLVFRIPLSVVPNEFEGLLSEMNDKLAEAVNLYDNLLAQQYLLSTRQQQAYAQSSYPQYQTQQAQYQPQWNQQTSTNYAENYIPQVSAPPMSSPPAQKWGPMVHSEMTPSAPAPTQQHQRAYTLSSPTPSPYVSQQSPATPMSPSFQPQSQTQQQYQPAYGQPLPSVTLPNQYQVMSSAPVPPTSTVASYTPTPTAPPLSRHNTIQSHTPISTPPTATPGAEYGQYQQNRQQRASYIAHPAYSSVPVQALPPQQQAPTPLPVLPTAPTNAPLEYSLYGQSAPTVPAASISEPKEALLISFD
jgi:growth factor-regulated tyrosine kinase substrate